MNLNAAAAFARSNRLAQFSRDLPQANCWLARSLAQSPKSWARLRCRRAVQCRLYSQRAALHESDRQESVSAQGDTIMAISRRSFLQSGAGAGARSRLPGTGGRSPPSRSASASCSRSPAGSSSSATRPSSASSSPRPRSTPPGASSARQLELDLRGRQDRSEDRRRAHDVARAARQGDRHLAARSPPTIATR